MGEPFKKIASSQDHTVWLTQPKELEELLKRREIAFQVTQGKLKDSGGKIETAIQTAEAFGRGLFAEFINGKADYRTMDKWVTPVVEHILNPLGTGATFTNITEHEATSRIFRCPLHEHAEDPHLASLFTYGFLRGMLLSAFPQGELLMKSSMAHGSPTLDFTFKTSPNSTERGERERVKYLHHNHSNQKNETK